MENIKSSLFHHIACFCGYQCLNWFCYIIGVFISHTVSLQHEELLNTSYFSCACVVLCLWSAHETMGTCGYKYCVTLCAGKLMFGVNDVT